MIQIVKPENDLWSLGPLAEQFQQSVGNVQRALDEIDAEPALGLNGLVYYTMDEGRCELLREWFAMRKANRAKAAEWTAEPTIPENYVIRKP